MLYRSDQEAAVVSRVHREPELNDSSSESMQSRLLLRSLGGPQTRGRGARDVPDFLSPPVRRGYIPGNKERFSRQTEFTNKTDFSRTGVKEGYDINQIGV